MDARFVGQMGQRQVDIQEAFDEVVLRPGGRGPGGAQVGAVEQRDVMDAPAGVLLEAQPVLRVAGLRVDRNTVMNHGLDALIDQRLDEEFGNGSLGGGQQGDP